MYIPSSLQINHSLMWILRVIVTWSQLLPFCLTLLPDNTVWCFDKQNIHLSIILDTVFLKSITFKHTGNIGACIYTYIKLAALFISKGDFDHFLRQRSGSVTLQKILFAVLRRFVPELQPASTNFCFLELTEEPIDCRVSVFHCASLALRALSLRLKCASSHWARQAPRCSRLKLPL